MSDEYELYYAAAKSLCMGFDGWPPICPKDACHALLETPVDYLPDRARWAALLALFTVIDLNGKGWPPVAPPVFAEPGMEAIHKPFTTAVGLILKMMRESAN